MAYLADADHGIATIIVVDEPTSSVKYGSTVAAPYVSELLERALPYLEFKSGLETVNTQIENYIGMSVNDAVAMLRELKIACEVVGDGDTVISQTPRGGESFSYPISRVILYTVKGEPTHSTVPSVIGMPLGEAIAALTAEGLSVKLVGMNAGVPNGADTVTEQFPIAGTKTERGSVVTLRAIHTKFED